MNLQVKNKPIQNQLSYDLISATKFSNANASPSPGLLLWMVKYFSNILKKQIVQTGFILLEF